MACFISLVFQVSTGCLSGIQVHPRHAFSSSKLASITLGAPALRECTGVKATIHLPCRPTCTSLELFQYLLLISDFKAWLLRHVPFSWQPHPFSSSKHHIASLHKPSSLPLPSLFFLLPFPLRFGLFSLALCFLCQLPVCRALLAAKC